MIKCRTMYRYVMIIWIAIQIADCSVEITTSGCSAGGICSCNDVVTFMCIVNPYTGSVSWNDGAATKLFECDVTQCYPAYTTDYDFQGDITTGIFNMTFNPVTLSDDSSSFICNGAGIDADTVIMNVEVLLEESDVVVGSVAITGGTELKVDTSKCSFDGETIGIQWRISETAVADDAVIYSDLDDSKMSVRTNCTIITNADCGGDSTYTMAYTYTLPNHNDADEYYMFAFITYKTHTWKKQLSGMYRLKVQDIDSSTSSTTGATPTHTSNAMNSTSSSPTSSSSTSTKITTTDNHTFVIQEPHIYLIVGWGLLTSTIVSFSIHMVFICVKRNKLKDKEPDNSNSVAQTEENTNLKNESSVL